MSEENKPQFSIESVLSEVSKLIDTKVGAKLDDFKKTGLGPVIKEHIDPFGLQLAAIAESVTKLVPPPAQPNEKGTIPPEVNATLKNLQDTVKKQGDTITSLQSAKEDAEKRAEQTDRHSTIRTALSGLQFVNEKAQDTAFSIVAPFVRRLEDGALVAGPSGGENFPVDGFVKDYLAKEHGYLFKATGSSGSGATPSASGVRLGQRADTSVIKTGMKPEDRQAVVDSIAAALQQAG